MTDRTHPRDQTGGRARIAPAYTPSFSKPRPPWNDEADVCIEDVEVLVTAPDGVNLVIVRVRTNHDGLYGLGCATFTQRALVVQQAVETYLKPLVKGRSVHDITDVWHASAVDSYWRGGPVLNSAISGIDMALWDIKGKLAGMPVWQLLGGRVRTDVEAYTHASGRDLTELSEHVEQCISAGYRNVRCQITVPGTSTYGAAQASSSHITWDPEAYLRFLPEVFSELMHRFGDQVRLLHDVHERLHPRDAIRLINDLEPLNLLFIEDPIAPEDLRWMAEVRSQTRAPIAFGELLTSREEYSWLINNRLIDYVRCHVSALGGITPAWRLAAIAEANNVSTAWHGPRDVSPVGHAANLAMDVASPAFGIHEHFEFSEAAHEIFPGTPVAVDGAIAPNSQPGLGVDIDDAAAAKHPPTSPTANWHYSRVRRRDGTVQRP